MSLPEAREDVIKSMVAAQAHLGTKNVDHQMHDYIWRRRSDGVHILDIGKTWEKIQLAARIIVTIENPADVIAISARPYAQRAVLKYATYTGAQSIAGRYTPGTFTNQNTKQVCCFSLQGCVHTYLGDVCYSTACDACGVRSSVLRIRVIF